MTRRPAHRHPGLRPRQPPGPGVSSTRSAASAAAVGTAPRHLRHFGSFTSPWEMGEWARVVARLSEWLRRHDLTPGHHHYLPFRPQLDRKGRFRNLSEAGCGEHVLSRLSSLLRVDVSYSLERSHKETSLLQGVSSILYFHVVVLLHFAMLLGSSSKYYCKEQRHFRLPMKFSTCLSTYPAIRAA